MATRLHGILLDGLNKPIINATVTLIARSNTLIVLGSSEAIFRTNSQGAYNITVNPGHYVVIVGPQGKEPYKAGEIVLYADSPEGSLNGYLVNWVEEELTPDVIKQVQQLVANSEEYALQAGRSAAAANADATDARNSKASAAQSASDALVYKNDAKASEDAARQAQAGAAGSANTASQAVTTIQGLKSDVEQLKADTQGIKDSAVTETTALKDAAAASATQASNSATEAGQQAGNAGTSATAAKNDADRAKVEADRAEVAANRAPDLQPFPDVWIPFNDSLDMLAGYSPGYKKITVGEDVITLPSDKVVNFSRASNATYINKHGEFCIANMDEPRFEKQGLLIEGQRTNHITFSNDPASLNSDKYRSDVTYGVDKYGFTYTTATVNQNGQGDTPSLFYCEYNNSIHCEQNEYATLSIRVKANNISIIPQFYALGEDNALILVTRSIVSCDTGEVTHTLEARGTVTHRIIKEDNGWLKVEITCKFSDIAGAMIGSINYARGPNGDNVQVGDTISFCNPQFEKGFCASSFIITGSTPATRAVDYVTIPARNNFSGTNISFLAEVSVNWDSFQLYNTYPMIIDNNQYFVRGKAFVAEFEATSTTPYAYVVNEDGSTILSKGYAFEKQPSSHVFGFIFSGNGDVTSFVNGNKGGTSHGSTWKGTDSDSLVEVGGRLSDPTKLYGHIRNLRIWNRVLTDSQMREKV
ncbi:prophage tail fiber N-terminal domain-containing protein [Escherichia coli]